MDSVGVAIRHLSSSYRLAPSPYPSTRFHRRRLGIHPNSPARFPRRFAGTVFRHGRRSGGRGVDHLIRCARSNHDRIPFDLNLAVVLAGFAFEAYSNPPESVGWREFDAAGCETVFLSEGFAREVYDGQLCVKLKKGLDFPAMDLWGTSDPYVVLQLDGQVVKSSTKWATKEPVWNENFNLHIRRGATELLQIAAWDANLVTPHKRMGNTAVDLASLCDGNSHESVVELEGLGGGGRIHIEVIYKIFESINDEKQWWGIPFVSDLLMHSNLGSVLKSSIGSENVNVNQFVQFAFKQLSSFDFNSTQSFQLSNEIGTDPKTPGENSKTISHEDQHVDESEKLEGLIKKEDKENSIGTVSSKENEINKSTQPYVDFWNSLTNSVNQTVFQKLDISFPDSVRWDGIDLLNKMNRSFQRNAEENYIQSGLAAPDGSNGDGTSYSEESSISNGFSVDIKKVSQDVLSQTENVLGALMILDTPFSQKDQVVSSVVKERNDVSSEMEDSKSNATGFISKRSEPEKMNEEDVKALFSTAESAMEAWTVLASSLGQTSFIKSDFEKICFLDNDSTDTQVAIWRDPARRRLIISFRGTEEVRWKDLRTDLMFIPSGLNSERLAGGKFKEVQIHSGFLTAYDSVKTRIMNLIKQSIEFCEEDHFDTVQKWKIYLTGHSLGGALATLLAYELSSSHMAKSGAISITMYNFGSPRVGNKKFAEIYNENVKNSWRIVNHRDIIPTIPRMIGYYHVAQPIYLAPGNFKNALGDMDFDEDEYQGDVIGEYTPDTLINDYMKGEKELLDNLLQTEINLFNTVRDGSALTQHMEDFYYIAILECVRSNYKSVGSPGRNTIKNQ